MIRSYLTPKHRKLFVDRSFRWLYRRYEYRSRNLPDPITTMRNQSDGNGEIIAVPILVLYFLTQRRIQFKTSQKNTLFIIIFDKSK